MAKYEDIEMLTVEEFMDGLDYAVRKKKRKLVMELKEMADEKYPNARKEKLERESKFSENKREEHLEFKENIEDTQRTQALKELRSEIKKEERKITPKDKDKAKMKTWKLVSGILSIVLSLFVLFQSMFAGLANTLSDNGEVGGTAGLIVAIMLLSGGIVSIAIRNKDGKGGNIAVAVLFGIATLVGFTSAGSYGDLYIWSAWCLINTLLALLSLYKMKNL